MENLNTGKKENVIISVEKGSIAEEIGIEPGDILVSINDKEILDVFDYRYMINDEYLEMVLKDKEGEEYIAEVDKDYDEDIGIVFESGLMDSAKSCSNKCIFCFIDQLPKGMRETLYFKDDDTRLSFLQGNYVTLTNMKDKDIDRIIYYHLSPINISVHATNPELRKMMLHNNKAGNILERMQRLANAGIELHLQVVLCKGVNDGAELDRTIGDIVKLFPQAESMSVVPVGLTKYRDGLFKQQPFTKEDAIRVLNQIEGWQNRNLETYGSRIVYAADEFYLKAERETPKPECYEDFPQFENGVGMLSLFKHEFYEMLPNIKDTTKKRTVSLATGVAAYGLMREISDKISEKCENININVYCIKNKFFGETITVSGLLTGGDIIEQLKDKELGDYLILPDSLLRNGETVLLDNVYVSDIEKELGVPIKIALNLAESLIDRIMNMEEN
ncbi:hypothetical protein SDC9_103798 [bioreactor metagenome]|uniref:PDZ domain-containing protein n=1 Tax=bioreactor metagenome TaxID=1076179 RepID=A0A645AXF2_9ZZZZ|nr:DUF512 domain-containing protein [Candidatus Metalachnospira sp.]